MNLGPRHDADGANGEHVEPCEAKLFGAADFVRLSIEGQFNAAGAA
jgi:hypothetical protein